MALLTPRHASDFDSHMDGRFLNHPDIHFEIERLPEERIVRIHFYRRLTKTDTRRFILTGHDGDFCNQQDLDHLAIAFNNKLEAGVNVILGDERYHVEPLDTSPSLTAGEMASELRRINPEFVEAMIARSEQEST